MNPATKGLENVIKKESSGNDASGTSGGTKIKFKPTVPKKKAENSEIGTPSNTSFQSQTSKFDEKRRGPGRDYSQQGKKNEGIGGRFGRGDRSGGRGGGSGGRFQMPTGQAFFQGGSGTSSTSSAHIGASGVSSNTAIRIGASNPLASKDGSYDKIKKEIEAADDLKQASSSSAGLVADSEREEEAEWDESKSFHAAHPAVLRKQSQEEVWPPPPGTFDPMAPVHLPFGPRTLPTQIKRTEQPVFAASDDFRALEEEERTSMFLIQLPSVFKMKTRSKKVGQNSSKESAAVEHGREASGVDGAGEGLNPGKIGKLKIMKSGRVFLETIDGKRYEVSSGLEATFMQHVAALELSEEDTPAPAPAAAAMQPPLATSKRGAPQPAIAKDDSEGMTGPARGDLYIMGPITRKLVVVPDFEIGLGDSTTKERKPFNIGDGQDLNIEVVGETNVNVTEELDGLEDFE